MKKNQSFDGEGLNSKNDCHVAVITVHVVYIFRSSTTFICTIISCQWNKLNYMIYYSPLRGAYDSSKYMHCTIHCTRPYDIMISNYIAFIYFGRLYVGNISIEFKFINKLYSFGKLIFVQINRFSGFFFCYYLKIVLCSLWGRIFSDKGKHIRYQITIFYIAIAGCRTLCSAGSKNSPRRATILVCEQKKKKMSIIISFLIIFFFFL